MTGFDARAAARDALLAGLVAFGLFAPLVGLRTDVAPSGALFVRTRWWDVALLVAAVMAGRLAIHLAGDWRARRVARPMSARTTTAMHAAGG
jgi:branched-chain amino acid transport system permease protein